MLFLDGIVGIHLVVMWVLIFIVISFLFIYRVSLCEYI